MMPTATTDCFRLSEELLYHSNQVTFYAEQLSMLTNVKRCTDEFDTTVNALATNGDNLMRPYYSRLNHLKPFFYGSVLCNFIIKFELNEIRCALIYATFFLI